MRWSFPDDPVVFGLLGAGGLGATVAAVLAVECESVWGERANITFVLSAIVLLFHVGLQLLSHLLPLDSRALICIAALGYVGVLGGFVALLVGLSSRLSAIVSRYELKFRGKFRFNEIFQEKKWWHDKQENKEKGRGNKQT